MQSVKKYELEQKRQRELAAGQMTLQGRAVRDKCGRSIAQAGEALKEAGTGPEGGWHWDQRVKKSG